uniref:NS2 n=1 Tax=uncultured densovirus TaxID=748192 RepID=A0A7L7YQI9_9VIRU|nr:NS2 [uncultured densovirus]
MRGKQIKMTDRPPAPVEEEERSESEVSSDEEEAERLFGVKTMEEIIQVILTSSLPLSSKHVGYLLAFHDYLETEGACKEVLPHLWKVILTWNNASKTSLKIGAIAYLRSLDSLLGVTYRTSFPAETVRELNSSLTIFLETLDFTSADLSSLVKTRITSTSSTTARSQRKRVGAAGSNKRKLCLDSDEEIDLPIHGPSVIPSQLPTSKTFSFTTAMMKGIPHILKSEDQWNDYLVKVQLWRSKDLKDVTDWQTKSHRVRKTIQFHFSEKNGTIGGHLSGLEDAVRQSLEKKAKWAEAVQYYANRK